MSLLLHTDIEGSITGVETHHILHEKEVQTQLSARKVLMAYWDAQGNLLLEFLDHRARVNTDCYCTAVWHLRDAIWRKRCTLITEKVIFLHNSAHSYVASA